MRKAQQTEVEIQVAPMLDMAFQLLTFFILTYQVTPIEGQFSMNLLPAAPAIDMNAPPAADSAPADPSVPASLRTLTTTLMAGPSGDLAGIRVGDLVLEGLPELEAKLGEILGQDDSPFDQAVLQVDPRLSYQSLMRVIDIFARQDITKISFTELPPDLGGGGPPL